ncbi:MAG: GAF domain-containing protein [Lachnospiraceae bacterium]|nr:GAF domain-containing protein [Lachnospiraceae bacterium]
MTDYHLLKEQIKALADGERHFLPVLSNATALLYEVLPDINWAGFYFAESFLSGETAEEKKEETLILGPFQGKAACMRLLPGRGVCQKAFSSDEALKVDDVHAFPGHIACDEASQSEIVIPLHRRTCPVGVLDIDAPVKSRFDERDLAGLRDLVWALEEQILSYGMK